MEKIKVICEMEVTIKLIGGKYKPLLLASLLAAPGKRFNELQREIGTVSQRTLTNQLRELEADGLIERKVYAQVPPKVEYYLTEKGRSLEPLLEMMCSWGSEHMDDRFELTNPLCE